MNVYNFVAPSRVKATAIPSRPLEPQDVTSDENSLEDEIVYYAHDHRSDADAASYEYSFDQQKFTLTGPNEAACTHPENTSKRTQSRSLPVMMTDDVEMSEPPSMASVDLGVGSLLGPFKEAESREPCDGFDLFEANDRTPIQPATARVETVNRKVPVKSRCELSSDSISESESEQESPYFTVNTMNQVDRSQFVKSVIEQHELAVDGFSSEFHLTEARGKAMTKASNACVIDPIVSSSRNSNSGSQEFYPDQILKYSRACDTERAGDTNWVEAILEGGPSLGSSWKPVYRNIKPLDHLPCQALAMLYHNQKTHVERLNFLKLHPDSLIVMEVYTFCSTTRDSVLFQRAGRDSSQVVCLKERLQKEDVKQSIFWDADKLYRGTSDSLFATRVMLMSHRGSHFRGLAVLTNVDGCQQKLPCIVDGLVENTFLGGRKGIEEFEFIAVLGPMVLIPFLGAQLHMKSCCSSLIAHSEGDGLIPVRSDFYDFLKSVDFADRVVRILAGEARPWQVCEVNATISPQKEKDRTHVTQWGSSC
ncbi:FAD/NAD(P)-binding domain-containing protein [Perkinsela sp. CCAP 1560/4]|nr:FAD/NAD(P)-binding domain-containing protein [Perkinsela sp. CCAP 1560/4]|eukprot:KNH06195.1 FAD/NAD(P)-binding domain-containing protein [Perkinsela sp. CCAP 1560/4]